MQFGVGTGVEFFSAFRGYNYYYVDKTYFLEQFLPYAETKVSLFTRPRRFGKTLMLSMMAEFFDITKKSAALFEGLAISRNQALCRKWMNQYPVIFLTFKDCTAASCKKASWLLLQKMRNIYQSYAFLLDSPEVGAVDKGTLESMLLGKSSEDELEFSLYRLCSALYSHYKKSVILCIDEYDVPICNAQQRGFYDEMIDFMRTFLSISLKSNEYLMCAVLTGCLCISKESIFTGMNNLNCFDISEERYADAFGFTEEEVHTMLAAFGMADKIDEVREWYDGYHFGNREDIYCPWGITKYVEDHITTPDKAPAVYWNNTSGNEIAKDFLQQTDDIFEKGLEQLLDGGCLVTTLEEQLSYSALYLDAEHLWTLLYLAGYLTRANEAQKQLCTAVPRDGETVLVIPNKEVRHVFTKKLKEWFGQSTRAAEFSKLYMHFWDSRTAQLEEDLEKLMLRALSVFDHHEYVYHMLLLFTFARTYDVISNRESGLGRYDIAVRDAGRKRAAIIEVKRAAEEQELDALAQKALAQIETRKYDTDLWTEHRYTTILHYGIAFYRKTCRVLVQRRVLHKTAQ